MTISFADEVRNELARVVPEKSCCQRAELTALIRSNGTLSIAQKQIGLILKTENAAVARKIFKLIKVTNADLFTEILVRKKMRFHRHNSYQVKIPPQRGTQELLVGMNILGSFYQLNYQMDKTLTNRECCARSYLRGTFLGAGSINTPDGGYHLEVSCDNQEYASELLNFFHSFKVKGNMIYRKSSHVIYFKSSEDIVTLLNVMGAHQALLKYEDHRVMKNIRNDVNRRVNCETANLDKTINASMQQLEDIELILTSCGIDSIPVSLQEIAHLRIDHPYISLHELGQLLNPPLSKSGVNGRLRRISQIANKIRSKT